MTALTQGPAKYTRTQRALEISGITAFFTITVIVIARFVTVVSHYNVEHLGWVIAGGVLGGLLLADFTSGFVHWLADNWGNPNWKVLGDGFIRPFREHHLWPEEMTTHDWVELNGANCLISLPTFALSMWQPYEEEPTYAMFMGVLLTSLAYWVLGTNQFHAWAHVKDPSPIVKLLQRSRLILSREHHAQHHKMPHDRNYCITNGWLNPLLRYLRFFEIIEWSVTAVSGVKPVHVDPSTALPPKAVS